MKPAVEASKPVEVTKAFAPAMPAPMKVSTAAPVVAKGAPAKAVAKTEAAPRTGCSSRGTAANAGPTDEATAAMVAASNEHEFNKGRGAFGSRRRGRSRGKLSQHRYARGSCAGGGDVCAFGQGYICRHRERTVRGNCGGRVRCFEVSQFAHSSVHQRRPGDRA